MRCITSVEDNFQILVSGEISILTSAMHQIKLSSEIIRSFGLLPSSCALILMLNTGRWNTAQRLDVSECDMPSLQSYRSLWDL